jgi:hypothetical protein
LDVETSNRGDRITDKLSDDGDLLVGVDSEARTIERRVSHAIRIEVTTCLITSTLSAVESSSACERDPVRKPYEFGAEHWVPVQVLCPRVARIKISPDCWRK